MTPHKEAILLNLRSLQPQLQRKYGVTRLGIFGSVARNEAQEGSDVDIVYDMERPNLYQVVHLKEDLETALHFPIDLVRYGPALTASLRQRIENEAIYV